MAHIKSNLRIYLWVITILLIFIFNITDLVLDILYPAKNLVNLTTWNKIDVYYGYFTTQTNLLVVFYLLWNLALYIINKLKTKNLKVNFNLSLGIVTYITITFFIYWIGMAIGFFDPRANDNVEGPNLVVYHWFSHIALHGPIPIFMVINYIAFNCGEKHYYLKRHHQQLHLWILYIYPTFYLIYAFIRGEVKLALNQPIDSAYPYAFFNWRSFTNPAVGWLTVFGLFIVLLILITIIQYFYLWVNNKVYDHNQKRVIKEHAVIFHWAWKYRIFKGYRKLKKKKHDKRNKKQ